VRTGLPADQWKIVPLIDGAAAVLSVSEADKVRLGSPSVVCLPGGRIVVAVDQSGPGVARIAGGKGRLYHSHHWVQGRIFVSQDKGQTWTQRGEFPFCNACLFRDGESLYLLGHRGTVEIMKSADGGQTWSKPAELTDRSDAGGNYVQGPSNVLHAAGSVHGAFMRNSRPGRRGARGARALDILSAREGAVLTSRKSWTVSAAAPALGELVPVDEWDYLGIPFHGRPRSSSGDKDGAAKRLGWGDPHLLKVDDPRHVWTDSADESFHLLARAAVYRGNMAVLMKVRRDSGGRLDVGPESAPSGSRLALLPLPGGNLRFHALFDEVSGLFWLLSGQITDSMRNNEGGRGSRGLPCDERHRLQLHFSKNLVDWCFAGFVTGGRDADDGRNDARMAVRGEDLCVVMCSGEKLLCGMIPAFRDLVY